MNGMKDSRENFGWIKAPGLGRLQMITSNLDQFACAADFCILNDKRENKAIFFGANSENKPSKE